MESKLKPKCIFIVDESRGWITDDGRPSAALKQYLKGTAKDQDFIPFKQLQNEVPEDMPLDISRIVLSDKVPFKMTPCTIGTLTCCGTCTRRCKHRCLQDLYYRVYIRQYSNPAVYKALRDPNITYDTLLDMYYSLYKGVNRHDQQFVYAPRVDYFVGSDGKERKVIDPDTGDYRVIEWPESGLCPFCIPSTLSTRRSAKKLMREGSRGGKTR